MIDALHDHFEGLQAGDIIETWCSRCIDRTPHRYDPTGKVKLVCMECEEQG